MGDFYGTGIEIWAGFGPNGQLSCLHSFKIFWNHHIPQMKWYNFWQILMYKKYIRLKKKHFEFFIGQETFSIVFCFIRDTSPQNFSIMTLDCNKFVELKYEPCGSEYLVGPWTLKNIHSYFPMLAALCNWTKCPRRIQRRGVPQDKIGGTYSNQVGTNLCCGLNLSPPPLITSGLTFAKK